jgi:hypothetical protein
LSSSSSSTLSERSSSPAICQPCLNCWATKGLAGFV